MAQYRVFKYDSKYRTYKAILDSDATYNEFLNSI
jgi:hypothetical protein